MHDGLKRALTGSRTPRATMIIPVRCMTCGKVLADKWEEYVRRCAEADSDGKASDASVAKSDRAAGEKTAHGRILDELGVVNICCRIAMQTHVDMSMII